MGLGPALRIGEPCFFSPKASPTNGPQAVSKSPSSSGFVRWCQIKPSWHRPVKTSPSDRTSLLPNSISNLATRGGLVSQLKPQPQFSIYGASGSDARPLCPPMYCKNFPAEDYFRYTIFTKFSLSFVIASGAASAHRNSGENANLRGVSRRVWRRFRKRPAGWRNSFLRRSPSCRCQWRSQLRQILPRG
jgi:hypothetical protein